MLEGKLNGDVTIANPENNLTFGGNVNIINFILGCQPIGNVVSTKASPHSWVFQNWIS